MSEEEIPALFRPVTFEEAPGRFRTVADAEAMGQALFAHCTMITAAYLRAAKSCIALSEGTGEPEVARSDFIAAMIAAGVFVRM